MSRNLKMRPLISENNPLISINEQEVKKLRIKFFIAFSKALTANDCTALINITSEILNKVNADGTQVCELNHYAYLAVINDYREILRALIQGGVNVKEHHGGSLTYTAAENNYIEILQILIDAKADLNAKYAEESPIQVAIRYGHKEVVKLLLEAGAVCDFDQPSSRGVMSAEFFEIFKKAYQDQLRAEQKMFCIGFFRRSGIDFSKMRTMADVRQYAAEHPKSRTAAVLKEIDQLGANSLRANFKMKEASF